jgi:hypothetical protein
LGEPAHVERASVVSLGPADDLAVPDRIFAIVLRDDIVRYVEN